MILKRRFGQALIMLSLCGSFVGCNLNDVPDTENLYLPDYKGDVALILGRDTVNVKDFLVELGEDANIQEDENLKLYFIYKDSTEFELGSDFIQVNSFSNSEYIPSPLNYPFTPQQDTTIHIEQTVVFNFPASEGEQLDSTFFTSGNFELLLNSGYPGDVDYTVASQSFLQIANNKQLTIESKASYTGRVPVIDENTVDLNGYKSRLSAASDSNKFFLNIDASVHIPAGMFLSGSEYLYFELNVSDPEFSAVFGDFGRDTFDIKTQTISLDIFSEFGDSGIEFEAPSITFNFANSFGIPVGLDFSNVHATFEERDDFYLDGSINNELQDVFAADIPDIGSYRRSTITMEPDNSNIQSLLASTPDELVLGLTGISNPNGETKNFLLDTSKIKINSIVHLPLSVKMDNFEYESEFDLEGMNALKGSENLSLVFNTINELPFHGEIDLFFVDENGEEFDSLKNQALFESPVSFDEEGKVNQPSVNQEIITLNADKVESLTSASELRLVTRLFSYEYEADQFIAIFSDYSMIISLSVSGKVSVDLNNKD